MLKNYLKITFRSLWKNKIFVIINILGLGAAMACCIVAYLNYNFGVNFDADQNDITNVYRVDVRRNTQGHDQLYGFSPAPLGAAVETNIGSVDQVLRIYPSGANFKIGDEIFAENINYVDSGFFDFFNFEFLAGGPSALTDIRSICISSKLAEKYFPDGEALGQTLTILTNNGPSDFEIAGVFRKKPLNSTFGGTETITHIDNLFQQGEIDENDWKAWLTLFVKVDDKSKIRSIEQQLTSSYTEIQNRVRLDFKIDSYYLEPFDGMAQRAESGEVYGHWFWESPPSAAIVVPGIMALLILLIACFNFTNTSMAIAGKRIKEIGLRKVMGGLRQQLILQFMMENMVLCLLALVVGLIMAAFLVPAYSAMWPFLALELNFTQNTGFYLFLFGILLFTGFLAGSYPAFYVSKFEPAAILRRNLKYGGTNAVTNFLLGAQFTISLVAVMMGIIFYQNAVYQRELDYGYNTSGTISLYFENLSEFRQFENAIKRQPMITSIAGSEHQMHRSYRHDPVKNQAGEYDVDILHVGDNFFETLDFELTDGRNFRKESETDIRESVIVTEEMVRLFGWEEPIGQKVTWMDTVSLYVIGVMKDAYIDGLWNPLSPLMLRYIPEENYQFMTVRFPTDKTIAVNDYLMEEWKNNFPDKRYTGQYLDEELSESADVNKNILQMFGFLGTLATFLSAMGLFSLVSLNILKRMKEIGVRKVLGASVAGIMGLINRKYLIILIVSSLLASVASFYLANGLMDTIWTYHITPGIFAFISAVILILLVAILTTGYKVYNAARANPTETIRME